jgi:hypothetical protein
MNADSTFLFVTPSEGVSLSRGALPLTFEPRSGDTGGRL